MADTVRSEAIALEVPVTVQGSKTVEGTDQRELFTETTKTTLVFANGAVVKLNANISPGQCVFLRNDQSEREILCKVLDSRKAGQAGYTDLEFTSYDPTFWNIPVQPAAASPKLTPQDRLEAAVNNPIATSSAESGAPANGQKSEAQRKIEAAVKNLAVTSSDKSNAPGAGETPAQPEQLSETGTNLSWEKMMETADEVPAAAPSWDSSTPASGETAASVLESPATSGIVSTLVASAAPIELESPHESLAHLANSEPVMESTAPASAEFPTGNEVSASVPETSATSQSATTLVASASPIVLEAAHESLAALKKHEPTDEELDWNAVKDAEMLAALAKMEAGSKANQDPNAKEPASAKPQAIAETDPGVAAAAEAKALSKAAARAGNTLRELTTVEKPVAIGIAAGFLLAASLALFWHMKSSLTPPSSSRPSVAASTSSQPKQTAPAVPASPSQTSASGTGANSGATSAQQSAATATQKPGASAAQNAAAAPGVAGSASPSKGAPDLAAVAAAKLAAARGELSYADKEVLGLTHRKGNGNSDNAPARIVSQAAPAMPVWAQGTEMDHVVTLDALIDEKGNLVETKPLTGSHLLWPEAQRAVAIWVFEPAMKDGQPTSSRMVLTVQFQK
jgi:hypothetical protein